MDSEKLINLIDRLQDYSQRPPPTLPKSKVNCGTLSDGAKPFLVRKNVGEGYDPLLVMAVISNTYGTISTPGKTPTC